jgi:hypothetical protein
MANTNAYVRKQSGVHPTPRDAGLEATIRVRVYDKVVQVNGNPIGGPPLLQGVAAIRFITQLLEDLFEKANARKESKP